VDANTNFFIALSLRGGSNSQQDGGVSKDFKARTLHQDFTPMDGHHCHNKESLHGPLSCCGIGQHTPLVAERTDACLSHPEDIELMSLHRSMKKSICAMLTTSPRSNQVVSKLPSLRPIKKDATLLLFGLNGL